MNKAGYTATSCGRVGRGGNMRFHTFQLVHTNGPTDQRTDRLTNGRMDKASYRVACPQLKNKAGYTATQVACAWARAVIK